MSSSARLTCPTCKRSIEWSEEFPWRPFCSERCKLVDLGAWLTEAHAIAGEPIDELAGDPNRPRPPETN
ncbi:MAG: DNA gyrase inhibitor YacG [Steroidobacteraceae bacterium]